MINEMSEVKFTINDHIDIQMYIEHVQNIVCKDIDYIKTLSLVDFSKLVLVLTPQSRSLYWESYLLHKGLFDSRTNSKDNRGDLIKNGKYYEIKTAYLPKKNHGNILFRGGQIRLYQNVDFYVFISINYYTDPFDITIYKIPHSDLLNHYTQGHIPYNTSHIANNNINKSQLLTHGCEVSITLKPNLYNWNEYIVNPDEL